MPRPFRSQQAAPWVIAALIATLWTPAPAHAWTRSVVTSADAELEVLEAGELRVVLRVGLQVQGGWLSSFDVAGLEPDLVLDPSAAGWLVARGDGRVYTPQVSTSAPGQISVSFAHRRDAPWRGDYELGLVYTARSPVVQSHVATAGRRVIAWQLPAWDRGLEDVRVRITARGPVEALLDPELAHTVQLSADGTDTHGVLELRRVQLPRATPWTVRFSVPGASVQVPDSPLQGPVAPALPRSSTRPDRTSLALAALLALLAMAKHRSVDRAARRRGARALALVPMPALLRSFAIVALCGAGALFSADRVSLALSSWCAAVLLGLHRAVRPLRANLGRHGHHHRPQDPRRLVRTRVAEFSELVVGRAWLDLTTPVGALLATSLLGFGLAVHALQRGSAMPLLGALLALPLFVSGTRLHLPAGRASRLQALARVAAALTTDLQSRTQLVATHDGADVRLRAATTTARIDEVAIVMHDVAWLGRVRTVTALYVRAAVDSDADELLGRALLAAERTTGERGTEWLQPTGTPAADLANLLGWLDTLAAERRAAA